MLNTTELLAWLGVMNQRYSDEGLQHRARPFRAMIDFTREHQCSMAEDDPIAKQIFEWFYKHSPANAHQVGAVYAGIYLFDTVFWPVHIPLAYGKVKINPIDSLDTMPAQIKATLATSQLDVGPYLDHWVNCMDYGYGQMDLGQASKLHPRALSLFSSAHSELVGANSQLLVPRPNAKAILGMRMATEIFLKTVLVQQRNLAESELMKISHKLEDAANACTEITKDKIFEEIGKRVSLYPPVAARYSATAWSNKNVWDAALLTQLTAATVTRLFTDRNMRASMMPRAQPSA